MERLIFHVDVNSAFLSWEAVRRLRAGDPVDLRQIPAAVGGDRDKRTGVIVAKSIPAKGLGVRTGEPVSQALRKCPQLVLAKPDFHLYEANSRAFIAICRRLAPVVEQYSIDECFLDLTGTSRIYPDPIAAAHLLKDTVYRELGFTVNVGVSCNKLLAKMASDFEKPDRVHTLFPAEIEAKLWPLAVGELFSVGRASKEKLLRAGIRTIGQLAHTDLSRLQRLLGVKAGQMLHNYANGIDDAPVLAEAEAAKGFSNSVTLEQDVTTLPDARRVLLALADSVCTRMRAENARCSCVTVTVRTTDFVDHSHQRRLAEPTDVTNEIFAQAARLLAELWNGRRLRLLGLALTDVERGEAQLSLFPDPHHEKQQKVDRAVDALRSRFGSSVIQRGALLEQKVQVGRKHQAQLELDSQAAPGDPRPGKT